MRLAATMDLEKNFCTIMPVIAADAYQSRDRPIPLIIIYKGKGQIGQKQLKELNRIRGVEIWFSPKGTFSQRLVDKFVSFISR